MSESERKELNLEFTEEDIKLPIDPRVKNTLQLPNSSKNIKTDPLQGLTKEEEYECIKKAIKQVNETHDKELSLMKSEIRVPNQEFMVVSFVGPKSNQHTEQCGMKSWGVFPTQEAASRYAKYINNAEENKDFDVYVLEMYCWCLIPPDPEACQNQEYHDEKLNKLIKTYKAQQLKSKEVFDLRKHKLIENKNNQPVEPSENNEQQRDLLIHKEKMPELTIEKEEVEKNII